MESHKANVAGKLKVGRNSISTGGPLPFNPDTMIVEDRDTDDSYRVNSYVEAFAAGFQMADPVIHDTQNVSPPTRPTAARTRYLHSWRRRSPNCADAPASGRGA